MHALIEADPRNFAHLVWFAFPNGIYLRHNVVMSVVEEHPVEELLHAFPELRRNTPELIATLKAGLPADRVEQLRALLDLTAGQIGELLGIPSSTLARRRRVGRLDKDESERSYRITLLALRAAEVFGSVERGRAWLKKPQFALGGVTPLAFADTEPGAREVEDLLGRIEHGLPV